MRIIHTEVFQYAELSEDAQSKARDWYRQASASDYFWSEYPTEDFKEVLKAAGFELSQRHKRDVLYWSGFSSQGDGACFGATWRASRCDVTAILADRPVSYTDDKGAVQTCKGNARLVSILQRIAAIAGACATAYGEIVCNDRYHSTRCESATKFPDDEDYNGGDDETLRAELEDIAQDLASYFYRSLEEAYDYQNSDECVAETIEANEYEFTEEGERA